LPLSSLESPHQMSSDLQRTLHRAQQLHDAGKLDGGVPGLVEG
jgi:hypothetical protein